MTESSNNMGCCCGGNASVVHELKIVYSNMESERKSLCRLHKTLKLFFDTGEQQGQNQLETPHLFYGVVSMEARRRKLKTTSACSESTGLFLLRSSIRASPTGHGGKNGRESGLGERYRKVV